MNIGIVVDNELDNDKRVLREIDILRKGGYNIFVLCYAFDGKKYKSHEGIVVRRLKIYRKLKNLLFFLINTVPVYEWIWSWSIKRFILENNVQLIHTHDLYMSRCSDRGIKLSGQVLNLILDLHENFSYSITSYNWTKGFFRRLISRPYVWIKKEQNYLDLADGIIVLSEEYRDNLISRYDSLKNKLFCVLPNVPDIESFNQTVSLTQSITFEKKAPVIFYYGIVAERRGIFDALNVFTEVIDSGIDLQFLIIGPVDKKDSGKFIKKIESEEIRKKVSYIPWIEHSQLLYYLNISDICIAPFLKNPQHESGVANKIYEYMLGAKPLIVSDCTPQKSLVENNHCGLVYSNLSEFKEAIIKLVSDRQLREKLGKNGMEAIIRNYNSSIIVENLISLYKTLLLKDLRVP